jgi:hypothetical protein
LTSTSETGYSGTSRNIKTSRYVPVLARTNISKYSFVSCKCLVSFMKTAFTEFGIIRISVLKYCVIQIVYFILGDSVYGI